MEMLTQKQIDKLDHRIKKAFEIHYPDYEFKSFKPAYAPRKFYLMPKGVKEGDEHNQILCILDSEDAINGFMYGAVRAITGTMKHNEDWENEL